MKRRLLLTALICTWCVGPLLVACGDDTETRRGVLNQQDPPAVGSYANPEIVSPTATFYNGTYYCIHDHVYLAERGVPVPMFTTHQNQPDEPTRCPK